MAWFWPNAKSWWRGYCMFMIEALRPTKTGHRREHFGRYDLGVSWGGLQASRLASWGRALATSAFAFCKAEVAITDYPIQDALRWCSRLGWAPAESLSRTWPIQPPSTFANVHGQACSQAVDIFEYLTPRWSSRWCRVPRYTFSTSFFSLYLCI